MKIAFKIGMFLILAAASICVHDLFVVRLCGDVLFMRDGRQVHGRLRKTTETHIFFDQRIQANQYRALMIRSEEVITIVVTVVPARLEELDPLYPQRYRDLAEELAIQKADPEARELALRLYLLAAKLGDQELRRSAFLGMFSIARSAHEERRFRALAYENTTGNARDWLQTVHREGVDAVNDVDDSQFMQTIRSLRGEQRGSAIQLLENQAAKSRLADFSEICTWDDIKRWSSQDKLGYSELSKLLQLEIELSGRQKSSRIDRADSWPTLIKRSRESIRLVDFSNVTEFDLTKSIYRNGQWSSPSPPR